MPLREITWGVPEKEGRPRLRVTWPNPIKKTRSRIIWFCVGSPFFPLQHLCRQKRKKETTSIKENILIKKCVRTTCHTAVRRKKKKKIDMQQ
ncbi:hypothetical protein CDAR_84331 [Caerostris darwini]|uniref:Uncharacterized protein n=1 Tax=Caerostris darwini TaxID=1538125 RepID=A0AAV4WZG2_9ARAC|nr:hypothetical protein CDAR_84331 [Caerostris darwini]